MLVPKQKAQSNQSYIAPKGHGIMVHRLYIDTAIAIMSYYIKLSILGKINLGAHIGRWMTFETRFDMYIEEMSKSIYLNHVKNKIPIQKRIVFCSNASS